MSISPTDFAIYITRRCHEKAVDNRKRIVFKGHKALRKRSTRRFHTHDSILVKWSKIPQKREQKIMIEKKRRKRGQVSSNQTHEVTTQRVHLKI